MKVSRLTAAVIASSVMISGAWAVDDSADTEVTLTIDDAVEVASAATLAFTSNSTNGDTAVEGQGLCTWSNTAGGFTLDVASANSWELVRSDITLGATPSLDPNESIDYSLVTTTGGLDLTTGSTFSESSTDITNSATRCTGSSPTWVSLTATLEESTGLKMSGSYSDTVTFTISSI